jgi:hypothetical protein
VCVVSIKVMRVCIPHMRVWGFSCFELSAPRSRRGSGRAGRAGQN